MVAAQFGPFVMDAWVDPVFRRGHVRRTETLDQEACDQHFIQEASLVQDDRERFAGGARSSMASWRGSSAIMRSSRSISARSGKGRYGWYGMTFMVSRASSRGRPAEAAPGYTFIYTINA
jgi:hypothetical protein